MAAIDKRKNVKERAEASVANLTKIALVPKAIDATVKDHISLDNSTLTRANDQFILSTNGKRLLDTND